MLEATVFRKIKSEHAMEPGFALIQSEIMHTAMLSITKNNTLNSANSMLHTNMEFFVPPAEARINVSKRKQFSAWDRMRCLAPDDPLHLVTG